MLLVCQSCSNAYIVPAATLAGGACQLSCVGCGEIWAIEADPAALAAEASAPLSDAPSRRDFPARTRPPRVRKSRVRLGLGLAASAALLAACGAIGARANIVALAPAMEPAYALVGLPVNLFGLDIEGVRSTLSTAPDNLLLVEGEIVNLKDAATSQPDLRLALRDSGGRELYVWTVKAEKPRLAPHERLGFHARLATPPDGVKDVLVKFVARSDKLGRNEGGT